MSLFPEQLVITNQSEISEDRPEEEWKNRLPDGYKFLPTDNHLIDYLHKKVNNLYIKPGIFSDLNVYQHEPNELFQFAYRKLLCGNMYFFSPVKRKDGSRSKNEWTVLDRGFWKASTKKGEISTPIRGTNGSKAALVYHSWETLENGQRVKRKQNWLMKEYRLDKLEADQDGYVMTLCVVYHHSKSKTGERSSDGF